MAKLFDYEKIHIELSKHTKSANVILKSNSQGHLFCLQTLIELEVFYSWLAKHVEVASIYISSEAESFSRGVDQEEMLNSTQEEMNLFLKKFHQIIYSMFFLPQTIVIDLGLETRGAAAEFSLGADLRIAHSNCILAFDHLAKGMVPSFGGIGILGILFSKTILRNWVLSGKEIKSEELIQTGFILDTYESNKAEVKNALLDNIFLQAPVSRIQTKLGILENLLPPMDDSMLIDKKVSRSSHKLEDWRRYFESNKKGITPKYCSPKDLSILLRESTSGLN